MNFLAPVDPMEIPMKISSKADEKRRSPQGGAPPSYKWVIIPITSLIYHPAKPVRYGTYVHQLS